MLSCEIQKIFHKAPDGKTQLKSTDLGVTLPLKAVITRWGTWIDATIHYCHHIVVLKNIVDYCR